MSVQSTTANKARRAVREAKRRTAKRAQQHRRADPLRRRAALSTHVAEHPQDAVDADALSLLQRRAG